VATIALNSVDPVKTIPAGSLIRLVGDFSSDLGQPFAVHVGPIGDATDPKCLSGIPGLPHTIYPINDFWLDCYLPDIDPGGPYDVFLLREDSVNQGLLSAVLTIVKAPYYSSVFKLRRMLPPNYDTGPRSMDLLEEL